MRLIAFLAIAIVAVQCRVVVSDPEWALTPGGYKHRSCCHHVPSGSHVMQDEQGLMSVLEPGATAAYYLPPCKYAGQKPKFVTKTRTNTSAVKQDVEGWHVYTKQNVGDGVNAFLGQWNVPDLPGDNGQTLFFFTGLQNIDWVPPNPGPNSAFDIIQPVLQYGYSEAGGGSYWTLASWYVPLVGDSAVWSDLINVNTGDVIFGNMTKTGANSWYINSVQVGGQNTDMTISRPRLKTQPWAYVVEECYQLSGDCSDYPTQPINFTNLAMYYNGKRQPFAWQTVSQDSSCNQQVDVVSASAVTISW